MQILVLDDPSLAASIARTWKERGEGKIEVLQRASGEIISSPRRVLDADLVVYPPALMGELREREMIVPLESDVRRDPTLAHNDFQQSVRHALMSWDRQVLASSFGVPRLMLLYRNDLLEQLQIEPPSTWEAYYAAASKVQDAKVFGDSISEPDQWLGVCEPGDLWTGTMVLAQAVTYMGDSANASMLWELRSMKPRLSTPPFERTLTLMAGAEVDRSLKTPQQCFHALLQGKCAMAVCWPSGGDAVKQLELPETPLPIRVAKLPGAQATFDGRQWQERATGKPHRVTLLGVDGRLISVTREARRRDSAAQRLVWLSGKEWGEQVGVASDATLPVRTSSRGLSQWMGNTLSEEGLASLADVLFDDEEPEETMTTIRIPGSRQYFGALAAAVKSVQGGQTAEEALTAATNKWEEITDELGREAQRTALAKSLGL